MQTGILRRLKTSVPFSETLNAKIVEITDRIKDNGIEMELVDQDPFNDFETPELYFEHMKTVYRKHNVIQIWTGGTENNIYGSPEMNYLFRFWHDYTHLTNELGFSALEEIETSQIQQRQVTTNEDKLLLGADITGQVIYHSLFGNFPVNQRAFVIEYIETGICKIQN